MEKIKLIQPLWNNKVGAVLEVDKLRAEFAIRKKKAIAVGEKAEKKVYKNNAEKAPKKNK